MTFPNLPTLPEVRTTSDYLNLPLRTAEEVRCARQKAHDANALNRAIFGQYQEAGAGGMK